MAKIFAVFPFNNSNSYLQVYQEMEVCEKGVNMQETLAKTVSLIWFQKNQIIPELSFCIAEICGEKM